MSYNETAYGPDASRWASDYRPTTWRSQQCLALGTVRSRWPFGSHNKISLLFMPMAYWITSNHSANVHGYRSMQSMKYSVEDVEELKCLSNSHLQNKKRIGDFQRWSTHTSLLIVGADLGREEPVVTAAEWWWSGMRTKGRTQTWDLDYRLILSTATHEQPRAWFHSQFHLQMKVYAI